MLNLVARFDKASWSALSMACHSSKQCHVCRVPEEMRLQHGISPDCDYRLALTAWANGRFEVIPSFAPAELPSADARADKPSMSA